MIILGVETTCDETAAAVVKDGHEILSNVVASQIDLHAAFGGVVPEVAARSHIEVMLPVIDSALDKAGIEIEQIDGIAVAYGPGLIGSLLIGNLTARTLAQILKKPLYLVNHVEAHTYASFLDGKKPQFPLLSLTVSGGHTQLVLFTDQDRYKILGRTHDDAVGEAFDKVAKILGLPYPGGPSVAKAAEKGDSNAYKLPMPNLGKGSLDFSFSGLKTAVLRAAQATAGRDFRTPSHEIPSLLSDQQRNDLAASFQATAVNILHSKVMVAIESYSPKSIVIGGGVAANKALREKMSGIPGLLPYPPHYLCTDNAAMIAAVGCFHAKTSMPVSPLDAKVDPILSM